MRWWLILLVPSDFATYAISKTFEAEPRVVIEIVNDIIVQPSSNVLKRLRQVPVVEGDNRLNTDQQ